MKKSLFMMGVAIAALSSCTQNEVLDIAESNTIQFGNSYIGKPTRANIINNEDELDNFYVYGFTKPADGNWGNGTKTSGDGQYLFDNEKVYKDGDVWKYDNIKKYVNGNSYTFAAYSDGGNTTLNGKLDNSKVKYEVAGQDKVTLTITDYLTTDNNDLLVSISTSQLTESDQHVSFGFKHALSQIKFTINNPLGNNPIEVTNFNVKIEEYSDPENVNAFQDKATLTYASSVINVADPKITWNFAVAPEYKKINEPNAVVAKVGTPAEYIYTIIPQEAKELTLTLTATLNKTEENGGGTESQDYTIKIPANKIPTGIYNPGFIYNFKMTLNMGYIYFDGITVDEWNEDVNENEDNTDDDIVVPAN